MDLLVVLAFIIVGLLQIVLPLALGYWVVKKFNVSWKLFGLGVLFFIIVQILHVPLVLLTQPILATFLTELAFDQIAIIFVLAIFLGLLAGLFEEPGRFLVFKYFFKRMKIELRKENALIFGLGWGGIESILIGVIVLLTMFSYIAATSLTEQDLQDLNASAGGVLTAGQLEAIEANNEALINLTPIDLVPSLLERIMALTLHVAWTLMVFSAIVSGRKRLLGLAILWHAAVDFFAVFFGIAYGVLVAEAIIFVFAVVALFYIRKEFATPSSPVTPS